MKWIMGVVATIIGIGFSAWLTVIHSNQAKANDDISNLTASVAALNENKMGTQRQFDEVNRKLDKIDSKLDQFITNQTKR